MSRRPPIYTGRRHHVTIGRAFWLLAVIWCGVWVWLGTQVAAEVRGLTQLSDTVVSAGRAAEASADALEQVGGLPLVGERVEEPVRRVREAGRDAVASGRASRDSAENLSLLLGVAIAVIPCTPVLLLLVLRRGSGA